MWLFFYLTCNFNLFFLCTWRNKTYLLTHSLTHSLTNSLTHSYTDLLTYLFTYLLNETVSKDTQILLLSLGLIKHIHDMNKLLYYGHWTDKRKYIPYISVTQKVVKSCGSKMATCYMMYIMYDVHKASSLYKKTCRQSFFMYNFFFIVFFPFFFLFFILI